MRTLWMLAFVLLTACSSYAGTPTQTFATYSSTRSFVTTFSTANDTTLSNANGSGEFTSNLNAAMSSLSAAGGGIVHIPAPVSGTAYNATDWIAIPSNVALYCDAGSTIDFAGLGNARWAMVTNASLGATLNQNIGVYGCNFDMKWDGIGGTGHGGTKFVPKPPEATYRMGIQFTGVDTLILDHVTITKARNWGFAGNRLHGVHINEVTVNSYTSDSAYSNEGTFQFQGENSHLRIKNLRGTTNDDMLAFVNGWIMGKTIPGDGPITDVIADGIYLNTDGSSANGGLGNRIYSRDPLNGIRIESARQLMSNITIRNVVGRVREQFIEFGCNNNFDARGNYGYGNLGTIHMQNWTVASAQSPGRVTDPPTQIYPSLGYINGYIDTLRLTNINLISAPGNTPPIWLTPNLGSGSMASMGHIKNLIIDGFTTGYTATSPLIRVGSGATLENLHVRNWNGLTSNSYFLVNGGNGTTATHTYGFDWTGKVSGSTLTSHGATDAMAYTSTPTHATTSLPQNLTYDSVNGRLTWSAVTGATTYTVYHQYIYGLEASPFYTIAADETLGTTSATSYTLPAYTSGQWHVFSVKANNQSDPARGIYASIGSSSAVGQNFGFIENATVTESGGVYTVSGTMTRDMTITPSLIPGATVSSVSYPTANSWQFTVSGLSSVSTDIAVWGQSDGGIAGPEQVVLSSGGVSAPTTTATYRATMRATFR